MHRDNDLLLLVVLVTPIIIVATGPPVGTSASSSSPTFGTVLVVAHRCSYLVRAHPQLHQQVQLVVALLRCLLILLVAEDQDEMISKFFLKEVNYKHTLLIGPSTSSTHTNVPPMSLL